ncbi:MAG: glycosyltransferase, partial [Planctomycetales bacterium]|nr:glycosyltransferase [Planctomycetales bacterium]
VWTLHDMNALTGGCHFSGGCQRFRLGCGNCPQIKQSHQNDMSFRSFETKRNSLQEVNLHVVAPSRWLLGLAQSSPMFSAARSFTRIPYGMPTESLYPVDTAFARETLGIATNAFLLGFGAMNLDSRRKGAAELLRALRSVGYDRNVKCLVFGAGNLATDSEDLPEMIHVGRVDDERTRRMVYSAADAFVLPSTEDNLPLTGLEAMACGTPVIGFDAGGIPDYVIPGETGLLAENGNSAQLGERLLFAATNPEQMKSMGAKARDLIVNQFEANGQALAYLDLYHKLLDVADRSARRAA